MTIMNCAHLCDVITMQTALSYYLSYDRQTYVAYDIYMPHVQVWSLRFNDVLQLTGNARKHSHHPTNA